MRTHWQRLTAPGQARANYYSVHYYGAEAIKGPRECLSQDRDQGQDQDYDQDLPQTKLDLSSRRQHQGALHFYDCGQHKLKQQPDGRPVGQSIDQAAARLDASGDGDGRADADADADADAEAPGTIGRLGQVGFTWARPKTTQSPPGRPGNRNDDLDFEP